MKMQEIVLRSVILNTTMSCSRGPLWVYTSFLCVYQHLRATPSHFHEVVWVLIIISAIIVGIWKTVVTYSIFVSIQCARPYLCKVSCLLTPLR